ncbi:MAG: hypothetical protein WA821_20660 [Anaerolineales bacterium]
MQKRKKTWFKRPPAVAVVAWLIVLLFLIRLYQVITPLAGSGILQNGVSGPLFAHGRLTSLGDMILTSSSYLALSLAGLVVLVAFLRMQRWSWVVLMVWTAISLLITLINYFYGDPNYLVMASNTIIALALNQADVQRIFGIRTDAGEHLQHPK